METRDHENSTLAFLPEESPLSVAERDQIRERIKIEFYKTYDVMTGIRIAATLGGFFSMMILLVLYKNYCKPSKTLSEEQLNAAVTAAAEEEDRALQAALETTSFYTALDKRRQSMKTGNQVLLSPRFSSIGGGYSHLTPSLKSSFMQERGKSLPGSVWQFGSHASPFFSRREESRNYFQCDEDLDKRPSDLITLKNQLNVVSSRRVSSVTCYSADSAYLERRCSAFEVGLPVRPHFLRQSRDKLQSKKEPPWDYYYPIDIQVIQPTPEVSPTASERNLADQHQSICGLQVPPSNEQMHNLSVANLEIGLAPLASISSLGGYSQCSSLATKSLNTSSSNPLEHHGTSVHDSTGSDSVFLDVEEMATDSEFEYDGFDDDYSFCEAKQSKTPLSGNKPDVKNMQFASFDSYDASIKSDLEEDESSSQKIPSKCPSSFLKKQNSRDIKRHPSLRQSKRKLMKTYSEPKSEKITRNPPSSVEKNQDGNISQVPSSFKQRTSEIPTEDIFSESVNTAEDDKKNGIFPRTECSFNDRELQYSNVKQSESTSGTLLTQGLINNMPLPLQQQVVYKQLSLPMAQERRSRLQKQKNFMEDITTTVSKFVEEKTEGESSVEVNESSGSLLSGTNPNVVVFTSKDTEECIDNSKISIYAHETQSNKNSNT